MAIGGDSWGVVVRRTFVEVVPTDNKHMRAKSEGAASLPDLPDVTPTSNTEAKVIGQTSVAPAPPSGRESSRSRPPSSKEGGALSKYLARSQTGGWCAKLCSAVGHQTPLAEGNDGQRLQDVKDSLASGVSSRDTRWRVVNTNLALGVGFRREPLSDGPRMQPEDGVRPGESFRVSEQHVGKDGVVHLRVAGGRGWLPSTKPNGEVLCERVEHRQSALQLPVLLQSPVPEQQLQIKKEDVQADEQYDAANRSPTFSWDDALDEELGSKKDEESRTTVVITNIASSCTRDGLLAQLDKAGLAGQYDFVYLPVSFETLTTHGYGIVDFVTTQAAQIMMKSAPDSVSFSDQRQGLEEHIANFQDSSLMHEGVPDQFKPVLFKNGQRIPFPAPTRPTRMPRELKRAIWRMKNGDMAMDSSLLQVSDVSTPKSQMEECSPCSSRTPNERRGGRNVANSWRARSRRDRDSCA